MQRLKKAILFVAAILTTSFVLAQRPAQDTLQPQDKKIQVIRADRSIFNQVDSAKYISMAGKVVLVQGKTWFYADSAILNQTDNLLEAFGNIHINDADSIHTYAQYLKYLIKEKKAFLKKRVRLNDGNGELTTENLEYNVTVKIGTYEKGGKLVNKKTVLTSQEGSYYGDTKDIIFKQKVVLLEPEYKVLTDTLQYNTNTQIATFLSPTRIISNSGRRTIYTQNGYFDMKNKKGFLYQRSRIDDSSYTFTADEMAIDDSTKLAEFRGNAVYRGKDTAQGFDLIANNIKTDRKKDILLATQKPILIIKQGSDSIFVSADTLYSARLSDLMKTRSLPNIRDTGKIRIDTTRTDSTNKFFEAYFNVKIYTDSLQATCDSLFYSLQDSVFRLFGNPIVWAKENQVTGDTIYLFIANKKPERLYVFENAMAISRIDSSQFFNQLIGNTINTLFVDGKIHSMRVKGNTESIFYNQDDYKKFIHVNKASSGMFDILFINNKPEKITLSNNAEGTIYPMRQVNHEQIKLRGFKWLNAIRPKSKFDILAN